MPRISVYQQRINEAPSTYNIFTRIDSADGIPKELFVYRSADDGFDHIATIDDFYFPATKDINISYYRKDRATASFDTVAKAMEFVDFSKQRINLLATTYTDEIKNFNNSMTTIFPTS